MKYFNNISTEKEAKSHYRELANIHHPDKGGDPEIFHEITVEYEDLMTFFRVGKIIKIDPEHKPARRKPTLKKEHADKIKQSGTEFFSDIVKTGFDKFFESVFTVK